MAAAPTEGAPTMDKFTTDRETDARSAQRAPESFHNERSDDKGTATAPQHVEFSVPGLLWPDEAAWFYSWTGAERHDALVKVVADRLVWAEWRVWLNPVIHAAKLDIYAERGDEAIFVEVKRSYDSKTTAQVHRFHRHTGVPGMVVCPDDLVNRYESLVRGAPVAVAPLSKFGIDADGREV